MRMRRAVGWCLKDECSEYCKGVFLLNHGQVFTCPKCGTQALVIDEEAQILNNCKEFREVRVEYNFDPVLMKYREIAIVRDENDDLPKNANVLTLRSPLIKTDKRALRVAESYLAQMYLTPVTKGEDLPPVRETTLDFDRPIDSVRKDLEELHYRIFYSQGGKLQKS
jgi:predicted RNA-binding Zn-ribbon protein involved in translation (DUF1610 family)